MATVYDISSDSDDDFEEGQRLTQQINASTPLREIDSPQPRRLNFKDISGVDEMDVTEPFNMQNVEQRAEPNHIPGDAIEVGAVINVSSNVCPKYYIECPICFDDLFNKTVTSSTCGHVLCIDCSEELVKKALKKNRNFFLCPSCRDPVTEDGLQPLFLPTKIIN